MTNSYDVQYKRLLHRILTKGIDSGDRTGVGTKKVFDANINVNLQHDVTGEYLLPALTLRKVFPRTAFYEMLWMLSGNTDVSWLKERNISIWDGNSSREYLDSVGLYHIKEGHIGKGYGKQFRDSNGIDQLLSAVRGIVSNPNGRRHLINLWNVSDLDDMALAPCHLLYQFMVTGDYLNLKLYQRSGDTILGIPTNAMFSAFFLTWMADLTGYQVGSFAHSICDAHIYQNHAEVAHELLDKDPMPMPTFKWSGPEMISEGLLGDDVIHTFVDRALDMDWNDVKIRYQSHPAVPRDKLVMAV